MVLFDEADAYPVLPAHAGMARRSEGDAGASCWFSPHTRGWPRGKALGEARPAEFSPHTRGWPVALLAPGDKCLVLPAHAGMARERL